LQNAQRSSDQAMQERVVPSSTMTRGRTHPTTQPEAPAIKRIRDIWPWIPVFKVVAETEHLPTAALRLHVSASALSRTVRLVEDSVGQPLFVRSGRRITLNMAGRSLLEAIQRASILLEQALPQALGETYEGEFRVSSLGVLTDRFVVPTLLDFASSHPGLVPVLTTLQSREANRRLAAGELELAFFYDATTHPGVSCRKLGALSNSVYCGAGHPLFARCTPGRAGVPNPGEPSLHEVLDCHFSVAAIGDRGTRMDSWPVELPRRIGFQIMMLATNEVVALSGRYLTVLPDVVGGPYLEAGSLHRLGSIRIPDTEVYAAVAESAGGMGHPLTESLVASVTRALATTAAEQMPPSIPVKMPVSSVRKPRGAARTRR
jgi:DNA-binding transcriptional LysR family regulator